MERKSFSSNKVIRIFGFRRNENEFIENFFHVNDRSRICLQFNFTGVVWKIVNPYLRAVLIFGMFSLFKQMLTIFVTF